MATLPPPSGGPVSNTAGEGSAGPVPVSPHSIVASLAIELIGVSVLAIAASFGEGIGKVMLTIMIGFFILWFLRNIGMWQSLISKV